MIIISSLGMSGSETTYRLHAGGPEFTTAHFPLALAEWFPGARHLILATEGASASDNGQALRAALPEERAEFVRIPSGSGEAEGWEIFETLAGRLPQGARVVFDMTHGFRSLPMLGFLALSYLRIVKDVRIERVLYGAYESRDAQGVTPVFDLTPFVTLLDWAQASERFLDTGDTRRLSALARELPQLADFAGPLGQVSAALALQRPIEAARSAQRLRKETRKLRRSGAQQRQLGLLMDHIEERFADIAHGPEAFVGDPARVLRGQYGQLQFYLRGGQFAQAVELMYEWLFSAALHLTGKLEGERLWLRKSRGAFAPLAVVPNDPRWHDFRELQERVGRLRNAFAHFSEHGSSLQQLPAAHTDLAGEVTALVQAAPAVLSELGLDVVAGEPFRR